MLSIVLLLLAATPAHAADDVCPEDPAKVVAHLAQGRLDPELATPCLVAAVEGEHGDEVVHAILKRVPSMARAPTRLAAIGPALDVWLAEHSVDAAVSKKARRVLRGHGGPWQDRVALLDADAGLLHGERCTAKRLSSGTLDEPTLVHLAGRLPDADLRAAAGAALVDLRLQTLDLGPLTAEAAAVTKQHGRFALPATRFPAQSISLVDGPFWVDQQVLDGTFTVEPGSDPDLREVLRLAVRGLDYPVGVCSDQAKYDPTPCVDAERVRLDGVWTRQGSRAIAVRQPAADLPALLAEGAPLRIEIDEIVHDEPLPVRLAPPGPVVFQGSQAESGPDLEIRIMQPGDHVLIEIHDGARTRSVLVEPNELGAFEVVSQGGPGLPGPDGVDGRNGVRGIDGRNAMCPYSQAIVGGVGGDGEAGQPGGRGLRGGSGGEVRVLVLCATEARCAALRALAAERIDARGGVGGPGGKGGAGGSPGTGGRGGRGATCQVGTASPIILPDERAGPAGLAGSRGPDGSEGRTGAPGSVIITQAAPVDSG